MGTPIGGRRRLTNKLYTAEDQALDIVAKEAEARLAARRAARAEAREIRMKELEKQQRDNDDGSDYGAPNDGGSNHVGDYSNSYGAGTRGSRGGAVRAASVGGGSYGGSRRSSEDSTDMDGIGAIGLGRDARELRHALSELEERFRKAMITTAQLDNEKTNLQHMVDVLRDSQEENDESLAEIRKEYKDKTKALESLRRDFARTKQENENLQSQLVERDRLINEHGLVLIQPDEGDGVGDGYTDSDEDEHNGSQMNGMMNGDTPHPKRGGAVVKGKGGGKATLISQEAARMLEQAGEGSLDVRLKRFAEEKQDLLDQIRRLHLDLDEERQKSSNGLGLVNGIDSKDSLRESSKLLSDYKFKLQKAEQEMATLQGNLARLDSQLARYKTAADQAEKTEDELKAEKRKLQRELREAQSRIEELESANSHLQKRIDKLKTVRYTPSK